MMGNPVEHPGRSGVVAQVTDKGLWVTLPTMEVRPRNSTALETVTVLLPREPRRESLEIPWRATASGMRGVAEGVVSVGVVGDVDLVAVLEAEPDFDED